MSPGGSGLVFRSRVVLLRHGETAWTVEGRFTGQVEIPLSEIGRDQARAAAEIIRPMGACAVVSSDLLRAVETAQYLVRGTGLQLETDPRFREERLGPWEGLTRAEVSRRHPAAMARWRAGTVGAHDGREGLVSVSNRAWEALSFALAKHADDVIDRPLVVVTHSNVAVTLLGRLTGLPVQRWMSLGSLGPGQGIVLEQCRSDVWQVTLRIAH